MLDSDQVKIKIHTNWNQDQDITKSESKVLQKGYELHPDLAI